MCPTHSRGNKQARPVRPSVCLSHSSKTVILELWFLQNTNSKPHAGSRTHWTARPCGHRKCDLLDCVCLPKILLELLSPPPSIFRPACILSRISHKNHMPKLHDIFCACYPWLSPVVSYRIIWLNKYELQDGHWPTTIKFYISRLLKIKGHRPRVLPTTLSTGKESSPRVGQSITCCCNSFSLGKI